MVTPTTVEKAVLMAMTMFSEEYGAKFAMTDNRVAVWTQLLRDANPSTIMAAAYHLASTMEIFPPEIAKFRKTVMYMQQGLLSNPTGIEAWEHVYQKINGKDVELTEMEKSALKQTGGLYDLRRSNNVQSDRARYIQAFEGLLRRSDEELLTMPEVKDHVNMVNDNLLCTSVSQKEQFLPAPETDDTSDDNAEDVRRAIEDSKRRLDALIAGVEIKNEK